MDVETAELGAVTVYCASSSRCDPHHHAVAHRLGELLGAAGVRILYGGGSVGSMGALAEGALSSGGEVCGVIPDFMVELEWAHRGLSELSVVAHMHDRKRKMLDETDAVVALPGGCGTFEELLEAITWKRLGLFFGPIVIVNVRGYYNALLRMLEQSIDERFMGREHGAMWTVVEEADDVLPAIAGAPPWTDGAIQRAR